VEDPDMTEERILISDSIADDIDLEQFQEAPEESVNSLDSEDLEEDYEYAYDVRDESTQERLGFDGIIQFKKMWSSEISASTYNIIIADFKIGQRGLITGLSFLTNNYGILSEIFNTKPLRVAIETPVKSLEVDISQELSTKVEETFLGGVKTLIVTLSKD
jgi:hypothetical protein